MISSKYINKAQDRLINYYIELTKNESEQGSAGYHRLDGERVHIVQLLTNCLAREESDRGMELVWTVNDYLYLQGHNTELVLALQ